MSTFDRAVPGGVERRSSGEIDIETRSDRLVRFLSITVFVLSLGFFSAVTTITYFDPNFFDRMLIADIQRIRLDPIAVGATSKPKREMDVDAMPAQRVVRAHELVPSDFSIVMVFGDEAHLASPGELWRVKAGMILPGLGKVLSITENEKGGTIKTENAVLTSVPR